MFMNSRILPVLLLTLIAALPAVAQTLRSPRDSVALSLDTNRISINYGRPSMRGRRIMGELVPWDKVWRTGANEATHLTTNFDLTIGGVPLQRGKYTLWTLPSTSGWKLIINKQTGQWGTLYDEGQDYARFDAGVATLPATVETLTVRLKATGPASGVLQFLWENTMVSTTFEKNTGIRPVSPLDSSMVKFDGAVATVKYSKPSARGRTIWGVVVPYDSVWRTGANNATVFWCAADLTIGNATIPGGTYTLYSVPTSSALTLIVSKKAPGRAQYDREQDLARIPMEMEGTTTAIDPLRIWFDPAEGSDTWLKIGWADRVYKVKVRRQISD